MPQLLDDFKFLHQKTDATPSLKKYIGFVIICALAVLITRYYIRTDIIEYAGHELDLTIYYPVMYSLITSFIFIILLLIYRDADSKKSIFSAIGFYPLLATIIFTLIFLYKVLSIALLNGLLLFLDLGSNASIDSFFINNFWIDVLIVSFDFAFLFYIFRPAAFRKNSGPQHLKIIP